MPRTNLRYAICYPKAKNLPDDDEIIQVLTQCGLSHLNDKLDHVCDWNHSLSLEEQQKLAFYRIIINKPDILYLDEVTSALDESSEEYLYMEIISLLPNTFIISIGHRSTLVALHTRVFNLIGNIRTESVEKLTGTSI